MNRWPSGCHDPDSCARHQRCMYLGCPHEGNDIANAIEYAKSVAPSSRSPAMAEREALREALMNIAALTPETNANRNCTCTSCEARRIALAALTHAPAPASEGVREEKLKLFLSILEGAGGETSGNDGKWNWINYFCDDAEPLDTFNQASARKLTRVTHDSDADDSVVYLTDAGRAFISPADTVEPDDGEDHLGERR